MQATHEGQNHELIIDGLADLLYVLYGTAVTYGIRIGDGVTSMVSYNKFRVQPLTIELFEARITDEIAQLFIAMHHGEPIEQPLKELIHEVRLYAYEFRFPIRAAFEEAHRANMSKSGMNEHSKGGKGDGYVPPDFKRILEEAAMGVLTR